MSGQEGLEETANQCTDLIRSTHDTTNAMVSSYITTPLPTYCVMVLPDVQLIRYSGDYNWEPALENNHVQNIYVAAHNRPKITQDGKMDDYYRRSTSMKLRTMMIAAVAQRVTLLVISAI